MNPCLPSRVTQQGAWNPFEACLMGPSQAFAAASAPLSTSPLDYPCRCLCFGLEQMTITFLFRRIRRQFMQILRTDGRTFISNKEIDLILKALKAVYGNDFPAQQMKNPNRASKSASASTDWLASCWAVDSMALGARSTPVRWRGGPASPQVSFGGTCGRRMHFLANPSCTKRTTIATFHGSLHPSLHRSAMQVSKITLHIALTWPLLTCIACVP